MSKAAKQRPQKGSRRGERPAQTRSRSRGRSASPRIDVGILTIRDDEFEAVLQAFPDKDGFIQKRRDYTIRRADAGGGDTYRVAILRQAEQGNGEAQDAARDLLDDLKPSLLLVVGIAGAVPSDDFTLGDVVLSTRVNDYSVEARKEGAQPTYNLSGGPVGKRILASVANLAGRVDELGDWNLQLPARPQVSWTDEGQLYGPAHWQNSLRAKLDAHFGPHAKIRPPRFIAGPIASSDRLVKDPSVLFPWIETARSLLAIEMESGGVYRAARERCPMLAIRGISDIVGLNRSNDWTKYACLSAAAFARAYLRTKPVTPRTVQAGHKASSLGEGKETAEEDETIATTDVLYANLVPLKKFPQVLYIAPATCDSIKKCWAIMREGNREPVPQAWQLYGKNLYSFTDPSASRLSLICDTSAVEEHRTVEWADSSDQDRRRLFANLLGRALREDLDAIGVWFFWKDEVFAFAGKPGAEPRRIAYQNLHQKSTLTVVNQYRAKLKDGTEKPFLRHNAFRGRFRQYGNVWYLEITPTYRFTSDGKNKYWFHEDQLKGIKRLEKNRSVLSQLLLWSAVLRGEAGNTSSAHTPLLTFDQLPIFPLTEGMSEVEWMPMDNEQALPDHESGLLEIE